MKNRQDLLDVIRSRVDLGSARLIHHPDVSDPSQEVESVNLQAKRLRALRKLCRELGGNLWVRSIKDIEKEIELNRITTGEMEVSPFASHLGLYWKHKEVVCHSKSHIGDIIHEMGHVFACRYEPNYSDELSFLGWEYVVAKRIGMTEAEWVHDARNYSVLDSGLPMDHAFVGNGPKPWAAFVRDWIRTAKRGGLLSADNTPRSVRGKPFVRAVCAPKRNKKVKEQSV